MRHALLLTSLLFLLPPSNGASAANPGGPQNTPPTPRPNILWITCEDISPRLGCYGDEQATTPNLDRFAKQGVRYTAAHHVHGVCRPARTGVILATYPTALGINHMRCVGTLPDHVKPFPYYLRRAGYWTANPYKTDYAFKWDKAEVWDSMKASDTPWRLRPDKTQPFFAVVNFTMCHESQVWPKNHARVTKNLPKALRHDPAQMKLPAYYPDTPKARASMARLYDVITAMDVAVGRVLEALEKDGLAEDTIVLFWSDHGDGLPRAKRWVYDSGTHVPLIARVPEKFRHLYPAEPDSTNTQLISMIDLGPTMLHLAGADTPKHVHGRNYLTGKPRQYVHAARDRIDERYDMVRAVRDERYLYIMNLMPHYPALRQIDYAENNAIRQELRRLHAEGKLKPEAAQFLKTPRPFEELYDTHADPDEVRNLAKDPKHQETLGRMRFQLISWTQSTSDAHLLPEPLLKDTYPIRKTQEHAQPSLDRFLAAARSANTEEQEMFEDLLRTVAEPAYRDPAVRWWVMMGCGNVDERARPALDTIREALKDESRPVRIAAARALDRLGHTDEALPVLVEALTNDNEYTRLWAITVLDEMDDRARPALDAIRAATKNQPNKYITGVAQKALTDLSTD